MRNRAVALLAAFALLVPQAGSSQIYSSPDYSQSQNDANARLLNYLDGVLAEDGSHWAVYTYRGINDFEVTYLSPNQQDYVIRVSYYYDGMMTTDNIGTVDMHFIGNQLSCLDYWDDDCRAPLVEDRSIAGPVIVAVVVAAGIAVAANSGGSGSGSGGYSGQSRSQCMADCGRLGDPNPNVEAAMIAQCQSNC